VRYLFTEQQIRVSEQAVGDADRTALLAAWTATARRIGAQHDVVVEGERLLAAYGRSPRHYHDVAHLAAVLDHVDTLSAYALDPDTVRIAAWFHDAVYDVDRTDNEVVSAGLAETVLDRLDVSEELVAEVSRLIRLTAGHDPGPADRDGHVLCDADLAVLGRSEQDYLTYATAIRLEHVHVADEDFRRGRAEVLQGLLARPRLFRTPTGYATWEEPARRNLAREISFLLRGPRGGASADAALPR
jgi:predicted metal-dependent HD superfamily phosphohydrolase